MTAPEPCAASTLRARLLRQSAMGLTAALLAAAGPALAQESTAAQGAVDDSRMMEQEATVPEDGSGDIVVVAQGREQLLSDVPLAVSAVNAETLANTGANDIRQLNQVAPSLLVSSTGNEANGSARVRGIGTVGDNPGLESSVAVFVDGVYRSRSGIGLNELGEIERVELLRGPQGTLFGRNASAGLINIISKKPEFTLGGTAELTYGNYDYWRVGGSVTGPISDTLAARLDGVYVKRDGFYTDVNSGRDINTRNRYFVRGQLLFEPTDDVSFRLIGDYTRRKEECCGAVFANANEFDASIDGLTDPANNSIIRVLRDLGQNLDAFSNAYSRDIYTSPGRGFRGRTTDAGVSLEGNIGLGAATLTSITAFRKYKNDQGSDTDYGTVDILYRDDDGGASRKFETFSQELRLQGEAFEGKLDWLIGGYFANEDLTVADNLRFGSDYGRFATCRIVSGSALAGLYAPGNAGCISAPGRAVLSGLVPGVPSPFGPAGAAIVAAFDRLDSLNDLGAVRDLYDQNSRNFAVFTHNIFHITDRLDLTIGARYTNERKTLDANFQNDNTVCVAQQQALLPFLTTPLAGTAGALLGLSCQGNSTAELNGARITDRIKEDRWTGTAVLSYKPNDDLLLYGSFSRGYKAGGFNLDRSALKAGAQGILPFAALGGPQALVQNLRFDPELVDAYEIGAKYSTGPFSLNVAAFRQEFSNFQLNTFNGSAFIVQTINGCSANLGGADSDQSKFPTAPNYDPNASATGACAPDDVTYGVRSQGVELEATLVPTRDLRVNLGMTYADTKYRDDLVGNRAGAPLDQALRVLPGNRMSNAPEFVTTASLAWTPDIGTSGLSGLFYVDTRMSSDYNTGSDLFPQKEQDGYAIVNARIGLRGDQSRWAIELWAQNLLDKNYQQVAFNSPFQEGAVGAPYTDPQFPGGRQIFSSFLAEPRTYGITLRAGF